MKNKTLADYMKEMEAIMDEVAWNATVSELRYFLQAVEQKKDWIAWEFLVGKSE